MQNKLNKKIKDMSNNRVVKIKILKKIAELGLCCIESFFLKIILTQE